MKKKTSQLRLPYFFGQQNRVSHLSGNLPELIKPESGWQRAGNGLEDILRWADDGGSMLDQEEARKRSNKSEYHQNAEVAGNTHSPSDES